MSVNLFLPQVTRIPITGPEPYNTLVCVSVESTMGSQVVREGKLSRFPMRVFTPFHLMGFDQRMPPIFDHSTTAWISSVGPCEDGRWLYAVDSVTGTRFSPSDGTYYIDLMVAISPSGPAPRHLYGHRAPWDLLLLFCSTGHQLGAVLRASHRVAAAGTRPAVQRYVFAARLSGSCNPHTDHTTSTVGTNQRRLIELPNWSRNGWGYPSRCLVTMPHRTPV